VTNEKNPLLSEDFRIPFHRIAGHHVAPGVREALARGQARIDALANDEAPPKWNNLIAPLDDATRWVSERIGPAGHLMSVAETKDLREAYNAVLPEITAFWTRLALNEPLWARIKAFAASEEGRGLAGIRARHLSKTLLEFRRAGADLPADKRVRLEALKVELAQLQQRFSENVLDATAAYQLLVTDHSRLGGVPEPARARYAARAAEEGKEGWLITLDYPSVEPILKYCKDRGLRKEIFTAHTARCRSGEWDNRPLVVKILSLRHELALLLGYPSFPDYRLEDHMVKTGKRAVDFEREMVELTRPYFERDVEALEAHARSHGLDALEPWDVAFLSEDLRLQEYDIDDEMLRPYFPLGAVMDGLFQIVSRVFGLTVEEQPLTETWHPDVRYYKISHEDGTWLGSFYTDWFPRKEKQQGGWMRDFITGGPREDGGFDPHLAVICGNFTPPEGGSGRPVDGGRGARANARGDARSSWSSRAAKPDALLTHREVETIFHEFGHLLHHCTSRVPVRGRAGLNVPWDWVELPSQIMENWTWERSALDLFARHHETGEPITDELFQRMNAARRFMGGWAQMRQISFGSVDLELHNEVAPRAAELGEETVLEYARAAFRRYVPHAHFADYHILTSFTHLFSGGYAAGYYSYLWSEVLDADAFTRFKERGIFDHDTGRHFLDTILSRGDSEDPEELFREFMGRDPDPSALLERNLGPSPFSSTGRA
jgi:oligopeptidase A